MFEVPVLAIVSQLYTDSNHTYRFNWLKKGREKLNDKLAYIDKNVNRDLPFQFIEFGTRRRANVDWHSEMLDILIEWNSKYPPNYPSRLIGTSNVMFATKKGIDPRGTMAHLWFQIHQQLCRLEDSQRRALQVWAEEYRGELGIALSDTLGFDAFLCDFDRYFAMLNDGCRHDSGDPITWANKLIKHYEDLKIDPLTKQAVFSDGLTFEIAVSLFLEFYTRIKPSFGIGTYLTNDCGFEAPQIVIKNTEVNGRPTAKISDSPGKGMCKDKDFENYLKKIIRMRMSRR
jgi:nicotinate phosphoribosyltransferase